MASLQELYTALLSQMQGVREDSSPNTYGYVAQGNTILPAGSRDGYYGPGAVNGQLTQATMLAAGKPNYQMPWQPNDMVPEGAYVGQGNIIGQANFDYQPTSANNYVGNPLELRPELSSFDILEALAQLTARQRFSK